MTRSRRSFRLVLNGALALGLGLALCGGAAAEAVLLENGSVVSGETRRDGDSVVVRVSAGGEVRLRSSDVAVVRPSLIEVYDWLRAERSQGAVATEDHLDLAEWCLRNSLWPQASRELLDARSLDPGSERVALLERRLMMLSKPRPASELPAATTAKEVEQQGAASEDVPPVALPADGLERFAKRIQPVLVNNCTTGGCHRAGEGGGFELDRRPLHGYGDARSTRHNLRTALAAIDLNSPAMSPLLIAARGPHEGSTPIRGPRREEVLRRLDAWVESIAAVQPAVALAPPPVIQAGLQAASYQEPVEAETELPEERPEAPRIERGGLLRSVEASDEFDPEVFNRRFRRAEDDLPLESGRD